MKQFLRLFALGAIVAIAVGCAASPATPIAHRVIPHGPPPETTAGFDRQVIEDNLLATARERFGEPAIRRALAAPTFVFAKYYPGMLPPPPPDAGRDWKPAPFPMALLYRDGGGWVVATPSGTRPAKSHHAAALDAMLADRAFWSEPEYAAPGCTDSGASLLMIKVLGRREIVRSATCGATARGERLVREAIQA